MFAGETTNIPLQEHSSDCLRDKAKQTKVSAKIQSVLCKDAVCFKRLVVVLRSPLQKSVEKLTRNCYCLYKKVQGGITNKAIVVVYIKLRT